MFLLPFISAIADAGGVIVDKIVLGKRRMGLHVFTPLVFMFLFLITALLVPFFGRINTELAFRSDYLFFFMIMIVLAIVWNIFYYQSIQKEKLYEHELIIMLTPAVTILLASVFFPERFDLRVFIAAMIGAAALFVSRLEKNHFEFNQYSINLIVAVFMMSLETIVINEMLLANVYSPVSLYALRTGIVALFFLIYYRPHLRAVAATNIWWALLSAALGVVFMILKFYGFEFLGVVHTTLILIISPLLVHMASSIMFKEKIKLKTVISAIIILACIAYATYIDGLN